MKISPFALIDGKYIKDWLVIGPFFSDDVESKILTDIKDNIGPKKVLK